MSCQAQQVKLYLWNLQDQETVPIQPVQIGRKENGKSGLWYLSDSWAWLSLKEIYSPDYFPHFLWIWITEENFTLGCQIYKLDMMYPPSVFTYHTTATEPTKKVCGSDQTKTMYAFSFHFFLTKTKHRHFSNFRSNETTFSKQNQHFTSLLCFCEGCKEMNIAWERVS